MIRRNAVPAALFLLLVAGCANSQDGAGSTSSGSIPSGAVPSFFAEPSPSGVPETTKTGKPAAGTTTISGTVTAGVEPNCLLLQEKATTHLLVFKDETLRAAAAVGSKVQVTGTPQPGMMSTCQQGEPFLVSSVTPG